MTTTCKACGSPKPDDKFRACPDCRAYWRTMSKTRTPRPVEKMRRTVAVDRDVLNQLEPAASARGLTVTALVRRLLTEIADDGMVDAILDDEEPA